MSTARDSIAGGYGSGVLMPPLGLLLLPSSPSSAELEHLLASGGESLRSELERSPEPLGAYHRFVFAPTREGHEALAASAEGELRVFVDVAAYVCGLLETTPAERPLETPQGCALLALARGSEALERGFSADAEEVFAAAAAALEERSSSLAAQLLGQAGEIARTTAPERAPARFRRALSLGVELPAALRAPLWLSLGLSLQELAGSRRGSLVEAIQAYQEAVHSGFTLEREPDTFALIQANLGLAYLALPMAGAGDALRPAVAVQSFREALKVYTPERTPNEWASVQLNLANALQVLPSSHPQENLVQAVQIYDDLLRVRGRAMDPVGHARLLANQANALAHLGMFAPALQNLDEAHRLFHWHGESELAAAALEQVAHIHDHRASLAADAPSGPA